VVEFNFFALIWF